MTTPSHAYPARLDVDYPERLDRLTTLLRIVWILPILIILSFLSAAGSTTLITETGEKVTESGGGVLAGLFIATMLMILFRARYPHWWFNFALELNRFGARIGAYAALLTDRYPSAVDEQAVHLDIDYPDVQQDLRRWLPLVKWVLVIPHLLILAVLGVGAVLAIIVAWFAILVTGQYPRPLFDYVVGVARWWLRAYAYAFLLVTDRYPPFTLR